VRRGVEVHDSAAAVVNIQTNHSAREKSMWNSKEIKRRDHLAMVVQEGRPALRFAFIVATSQATQIS
jgi:hypothetical protein